MKTNTKKRNFKRKAIVLMLSLLMVMTFMPSFAFAEGPEFDSGTENEETVVSEEMTEDTEAVQGEDPAPAEEPAPGEEPAELPAEEETVPENTPEEEIPEAEPAEETAGPEVIEDVLDLSAETGITVRSAANTQGVVVEATKSAIVLHIGKVGTSGTAQIYRYAADSYHHADPLKGISKNVDNGTYVADYTLGTDVDVETARYTSDGHDHLYDKFYIIQGDSIVAGPFYASEIASLNNKNEGPFEVVTKKGLTEEIPSTVDKAVEMGVGNTVINWDLTEMIYANEDAEGKPIDNSKKNAIKFQSNGETFYFNANFIKEQDGFISAYTKNGINVTLVIISWVQTLQGSSYPASLRYPTKNTDTQTMGFNTSNDLGSKYFIAAMEFIAKRYSDKNSAFVDQFVIGNEIDYTYDWYLIQPRVNSEGAYQRADWNTFMEEFARSFRLANLAVKKYNAGGKVVLSLTHNWAEDCYESYGWGSSEGISTSTKTVRINSYAPKEIVDWLVREEGKRGNFDWGLSVHPYPIGTTSSNPINTDPDPSKIGSVAHPINGNADTSPWITVANLELYQQYLERPANQYKGQTRTVSITEASICNKKTDDPDYQQSLQEQAASIAMMYYRAACIPCINQVAYFEYHDQNVVGNYNLGLVQLDGVEKPSLNVWKYVDSNKSQAFANKYLKYIAPNAASYRDTMNVTNSGYDWDKYWTDENLYPRDIGSQSVERSIKTDKNAYDSDESIEVTAFGEEGDRVCLFKEGEDPETTAAIYEYPAVGSKNGHNFYPGKAHDICAYGTIGSGREADALLKAGNYKVVLIPSDGSDIKECSVTLNADYTYGTKKFAIKTNKTEYMRGEDIIVSAWGENSNSWAGIYLKGATPGSGGTSIYWYYCNSGTVGEDSEAINGKPTVIQSKRHENGTLNEPGEYVVYLFKDGGYTVMDKVEITIVERTDIPAVKSLKYDIDVLDDGLANGTVTVTKDPYDYDLTDCIMYWADADGKPLEGIGALAEFKLTGPTTTYRMHPYTLIPEGAKKLIAYGANGASKSVDYVSFDLPADCATYHIDDPIVEFQVNSDIHITAAGIPSGGETRLSNTHFTQMLEDTNKETPDSLGIFIVGDIANNGRNEEFQETQNLYNAAVEAGNTNLPLLHLAMGNHDWYNNNPSKQFQKWVNKMNPTLEEQLETTYYDEVIGGYHFIFLGGEERYDSLRAYLSETQLNWFDDLMAKCTEEDPDKPVFVFLHQSFYNTCAGSLPGQGWDGIANEEELKSIMEKYGQIIFMNGHSHWDLNSIRWAYGGDEQAPVALNTASVSYLWSSYNITSGEAWDGSQGYIVKVYKDKVLYLGREYEQNVYLPSAMFVLQRDNVMSEKDEYYLSLNAASLNLEATSATGGRINYTSSDPSIADVLDDGTVIAKGKGDVEIRMRSVASNTHVVGMKTVTVHVSDKTVDRIYGNDRYQTSLKTADAFKEELGVEKFDAVILACGTNYADALAGSYLSAVRKAPILLVRGRKDTINAVQKYINDNLNENGTIYMLGGPAVVPDSVVAGLSGFKTRRLGGSDRYDTNVKILKEAARFAGEADEYLVASGTGFADSLSASAAGKPIILVRTTVQDSQKDFINSLKGKKFYIIGGTGAVNESLEKTFAGLGKTERLGGATRYETSTEVAKALFDDPSGAVVAYGANFPDGLCGGSLAYGMGVPLILAANGKEAAAVDYAAKTGIIYGAILGGPTLINDANAKKIFSLPASAEIIVK